MPTKFEQVAAYFAANPDATLDDVLDELPGMSRATVQRIRFKLRKMGRLYDPSTEPTARELAASILQNEPTISSKELAKRINRTVRTAITLRAELAAEGLSETGLQRQRRLAAERKPQIEQYLRDGLSGPAICRLVPGSNLNEVSLYRRGLAPTKQEAPRPLDWISFIAASRNKYQRRARRIAFLRERWQRFVVEC